MRIITISRQFGSGGRELGKRLADRLGWDYYDREIITSIAEEQGLDETYVDRMLERMPSPTVQTMTIGKSFAALPRQNHGAVLLGKEKQVIERIAARGRDCVIVGRNADVYLSGPEVFSVFICADMESRRQRCRDRGEDVKGLTDRELERSIRAIDKARASVRALVGGNAWGDGSSYRLTVNTAGWSLEDLASALGDLTGCYFRPVAERDHP